MNLIRTTPFFFNTMYFRSDCGASTPVFCRHPSCFQYYCPTCFEAHRKTAPNGVTIMEGPDYHAPVMRNRSNAHNSSSFGGHSSSAHGHHGSHSDRHRERTHAMDRDHYHDHASGSNIIHLNNNNNISSHVPVNHSP